MSISPVHRGLWTAAVVRERRPAALAVAAVVAAWAVDGRVMHGTKAIARAGDMSYNTAARGLDDLVAAGFLVLVQPARQRSPAVYKLARVPTSWDAECDQTPQRLGVSERSGSPPNRPRVPTPTSQTPHALGPQVVQGEQGGAQRRASASRTTPDHEVASEAEDVGPTFPVRDGGGGVWRLTSTQAERLTAAHPAVDVAGEMAKAALWCEANPSKRKTRSGMLRFLAHWMSKSPKADAQGGAEGIEMTEERADWMLSGTLTEETADDSL